jgi:surface antigen
MTARNIATTLVVTLGLAACASSGENEQLGNVLGAVIGGLAGAQVGEGDGQLVAVGVGAALGALIGGEIGQMMDEVDLQLLADAHNQSLENTRQGTVTEWRNPDTGHAGTVVPTSTFADPLDANNFCREFQQTVTIGGQQQQAFGTACRMPDGTWKIREG